MIIIDLIPSAPGTYALHMHLPQSRTLQIGNLGKITFSTGEYVYVGSALGPGGLRARVGRHLHGSGHPRWHVDTLRSVAQVVGFCYIISTKRLECHWSQVLASLDEAYIPAPGFGASDCRSRCRAHLVAFPRDINSKSATEGPSFLELVLCDRSDSQVVSHSAKHGWRISVGQCINQSLKD